ncbi:MAG: ethanolamine ammonia-lyase subunit EutC [Gemmataceae bacterium]
MSELQHADAWPAFPERTPARLFVGRSGTAYPTATLLELRADHAAARDAVLADVDGARDFGELVERHGLFEVRSMAATKAEHLRLPHRGRRIHPEDRDRLLAECERGADLLIVLGDGLSATAVARQAPALFERLAKDAAERNWKLARPFLVRNCRVGILNEIGDLLAPAVLVLLIGERPGLATAESLSAYLAYRPRTGHTDADRNLISNIHPRGVQTGDAAGRILALADQMRLQRRSGVGVTETQHARLT